MRDLVAITGDTGSVVTINDPQAEALGVRMVVNSGNISSRLAEAAQLGAAGSYSPTVETTFAFAEARSAHVHVETGHARGKTILQLDA